MENCQGQGYCATQSGFQAVPGGFREVKRGGIDDLHARPGRAIELSWEVGTASFEWQLKMGC